MINFRHWNLFANDIDNTWSWNLPISLDSLLLDGFAWTVNNQKRFLKTRTNVLSFRVASVPSLMPSLRLGCEFLSTRASCFTMLTYHYRPHNWTLISVRVFLTAVEGLPLLLRHPPILVSELISGLSFLIFSASRRRRSFWSLTDVKYYFRVFGDSSSFLVIPASNASSTSTFIELVKSC